MAKEKKETKKAAAKPQRVQTNTQAQAPVLKEDVYPAINIANTFGISSFDFYMIKEAKKITDNSLVSIAQFQKYYQEVVEGR